MGWVIGVVIVAVAVVAGWVLWSRSRKATKAASQVAPERTSRVTDPTPMKGLELALDEVTDRSGRKMRDKIESGTAIDDLIVPNDTGPILRRALDNVEHTEPSPPTMPPPPAGTAPAESGGGDSPPTEG